MKEKVERKKEQFEQVYNNRFYEDFFFSWVEK